MWGVLSSSQNGEFLIGRTKFIFTETKISYRSSSAAGLLAAVGVLRVLLVLAVLLVVVVGNPLGSLLGVGPVVVVRLLGILLGVGPAAVGHLLGDPPGVGPVAVGHLLVAAGTSRAQPVAVVAGGSLLVVGQLVAD